MLESSEIAAFTLVAALLVISPGPNGVLIAKTVPTSGRAAGFANVAGFVTAFYVHGAFAVLGISVLLVQSATAFSIVKFLGAAYLIWVGVRALIAAMKENGAEERVAPAKRSRGLARAYIEGFLTNALNPKVSMFYLAAFPQFMTAGESSALSGFLLVFVHSLLNALWFGAMVMLFSRFVRTARGGAFKRWITAATGVVFIGFGVKLASIRPSI